MAPGTSYHRYCPLPLTYNMSCVYCTCIFKAFLKTRHSKSTICIFVLCKPGSKIK